MPVTPAMARPAVTESTEKQLLELWVHEALEEKALELSREISNSRYESSLDSLPSLPVDRCKTRPDITFLNGMEAGSQRIRIECSQPSRWSLYARGHISLFVPVLVATRSLTRGDTISDSDVTLREMDVSQLRRGYLMDSSSFTNQQLSRRIRAGDVITPNALQEARLIRRGDRIAIVAGSEDFSISMPGEALEDGRLNQQIRVRNLSSGKTIRGMVSGNNEVRVL
ncbi:flagellar basal body P-ring formation chaperone FlgA [Endozoicomonas lisbonensis]|uniref:Flagella basal body P-ring formation protein FlgA n=1 Tax=Endozoicomonas lisbonensis TaxID=3120522 RepID=A0ABV2SBK4_9GAMM